MGEGPLLSECRLSTMTRGVVSQSQENCVGDNRNMSRAVDKQMIQRHRTLLKYSHFVAHRVLILVLIKHLFTWDTNYL